jgi:hypothetical protein
MDIDEISDKIRNASVIEMELVWLPRIMDNQTNDEKEYRSTFYNNGIGLNGADASYVTSVWCKIKSGYHLTDAQLCILRKILPKYRRQFARMMKNGIEKEI